MKYCVQLYEKGEEEEACDSYRAEAELDDANKVHEWTIFVRLKDSK